MDTAKSQLPFADDTIGFGLTGEVTLADAAKAMTAFHQLLDALVQEVAPEAQITWVIKEASASSYDAATMPVSDDLEAILRVNEAYSVTAQAMERNGDIPYPKAQAPARRLLKLVKHERELHLEKAREVVARITAPPGPRSSQQQFLESLGSIRGKLRVLSDEHGLKAWIRDDATGVRVPILLDEEKIEHARSFFRQHVVVQGLIRRSLLTGMPIQVRNVSALDEAPLGNLGGWRQATGSVIVTGDLSPEDAIRRGRDG